MTREENIRAILESNFAGYKEEVIDIAVKRICKLEQEPKIVPIAEIKFDDDKLHEIVKEVVKNIEIEPKWIPVSEKLPEPMQIVLICQKYKTNKYQPITVAQFNGKYFMWYGYQKNWEKHTNICEHGDMCPGNEYVDAWMPLPEPYKESEGNHDTDAI